MTIVLPFLWASLSLCFLVAVFRPLEMLFPARPIQRFLRPAWLTDLWFFLGQYLLWTSLVFGVLEWLGPYTGEILNTGLRRTISSQPFWLQSLGVVFLSDLCIYWGHRLQHRSAFLWRFHSTHHSSEHLDWLAAHREHPLDTLYTVGLINLPAFVLGFPLEALAVLVAFRSIWAIYIHSNVRLPIGPLRFVLGAPQVHHWHHDRTRKPGNYANLFPLMDLIFGTYRCPNREPEALGVTGYPAQSYLGHLLRPITAKR